MLDRILRPRTCFWLALCTLLPLHVYSVSQNEWFGRPPKPIGDGPDYENLAFHLLAGDGFRINNQDQAWRAPYAEQPEIYGKLLLAAPRDLSATGRPPLLPSLIAAVYQFKGRDATGFAGVRVVLASCNALAGALAVAMSALLLPHVLAGWPTYQKTGTLIGCAATLILASSNHTLREYATDFLTEPLALLLMQLFVMQLVGWSRANGLNSDQESERQEKQREWLRPIGLGLCLSAMILARSIFVVWLPGIALVLFACQSGQVAARAKRVGLILLIACLGCSPWWIRNISVLGELRPLGTQGPITLIGGYSNEALLNGGNWHPGPEQELRAIVVNRKDFTAAASDTEREIVVARQARQQLRAWLSGHWTKVPQLVVARVWTHWNPYHGKSLIWRLMMLAGLAGLVYAGRTKELTILVGLAATSTFVAAALYTTGGRFLVPLYGALFTLAGIGAASTYCWTMNFFRPKPN